MSDLPVPPKTAPVSWAVGPTLDQQTGDGPLEVRMTFNRDESGQHACKAWIAWLTYLDEGEEP